MATKDLYNDIQIVQALAPAIKTTTATSSTIDMQGYESAVVIFDVGASGDTLSGALLWTLTLTESDASASGFTAVAAGDVIVQGGTLGTTTGFVLNTTALVNLTVKLGYRGVKRYLRAVATPTGSISSGILIGAISVRGDAHILKVV